jgi:hypothetical protein
MIRKDYISIAEMLKEAIETGQTVYDLANAMESRFAADNPSFNRGKWRSAIKPVTFAVSGCKKS